jgi:hypothetical protein
MANCNEHFEEYNGKIRLTDARRKSLKGSRKELRKKVRKWFDENKPNETKPKFSGQDQCRWTQLLILFHEK